MFCCDWHQNAAAFYTLDQFGGAACVNIGLPDEGTPVVSKYVAGKRYVHCV